MVYLPLATQDALCVRIQDQGGPEDRRIGRVGRMGKGRGFPGPHPGDLPRQEDLPEIAMEDGRTQ
ncbi:MAG: hypothetical protein MZV70_01285 [Desulfobacterales bacterium]|nr:hypothetical protein [Desulfobacterales bacterium]